MNFTLRKNVETIRAHTNSYKMQRALKSNSITHLAKTKWFSSYETCHWDFLIEFITNMDDNAHFVTTYTLHTWNWIWNSFELILIGNVSMC